MVLLKNLSDPKHLYTCVNLLLTSTKNHFWHQLLKKKKSNMPLYFVSNAITFKYLVRLECLKVSKYILGQLYILHSKIYLPKSVCLV